MRIEKIILLHSIGLKSFINARNELILIPQINVYFSLDNVENELDFNCKVLEFCSRCCVKGCSDYYQRIGRKMVNTLLNTNFKYKDFELIYQMLGNRIRHNLTIEFIKNGYDLELLKRSCI